MRGGGRGRFGGRGRGDRGGYGRGYYGGRNAPRSEKKGLGWSVCASPLEVPLYKQWVHLLAACCLLLFLR